MRKVDFQYWKGIKISELFEKPIRPAARRKNDYDQGSIPFVASGNFNNGIERYVKPIKNELLDKGGCITISPIDGSCFYQEKDFLGRGGAGSSIIILRPKNFMLNLEIALFLCTVIKKSLVKLHFSDMANNSSIPNVVLMLPHKNGRPDWEYMESYMHNIRIQSQHTITQLYTAIGGGKKRAIDLNNWQSFKIGRYFTAKNTGNILTREISDGTGTTPYVTASSINNGVVAYIDATKLGILEGKCILVGGKTFTLTYQKENFVSNDSHNFTLKLKDEHHSSELIYLFLLTALRCSLSQKYSWGDAVTKEKMLGEYVYLPATHDGQPDWMFMEDFTTSMKTNVNNKITQL